MKAYDILTQMQPEQVQILISSGLLKPMVARDLKIYDYFYKNLKRTGSKMVSRSNAAEKFSMCEMGVSRILNRLNNEKI